MSVEAIAAIGPAQAMEGAEALSMPSALGGAQKPDGVEAFGKMVSQGVDGMNRELLASQTDLQELATGNVQNLHQIMIRLEETRLSFQLFMQVRNRLLEAYQDIMKMQV